MSDYVKATDFASKDALLSGNPSKIIKGTEIDTEFNSIATAIQTKADLASPTFTGTPAAPTAAGGTNTTQIATTAFVTSAASTAITNERTASATLTNKTISADNNTISGIAASSFVLSDASGNIDGAAAQKAIPSGAVVGTTDSQTLTNKTINASQLVDASVTPAKLSQPLTLETAKNSTSGTTVDFTGIPSWVKRITVMFVGVSTNGTSPIQIQIGAGSFLTSGYLGTGIDNITGTSVTNMSTGFLTSASGNIGAATVRHGFFTLTNVTGNTWVMFGSANASNTGIGMYGSGSNSTLGGTLDRVRITTVNGTDTFDAGSINIIYE